MSTKTSPPARGRYTYVVWYIGQDGRRRHATVSADDARGARSAVRYWRRNRNGAAVSTIESARRLPAPRPVVLPALSAALAPYLGGGR